MKIENIQETPEQLVHAAGCRSSNSFKLSTDR